MTMLSPEKTLELTRVLIGVAVLIQNLEIFALRKTFSRIGGSLPARLFDAILVVQLLGVLCLLVVPNGHAASTLVVFVTSLFISVHFRGSFNGGADAMTLVILSAVTAADVFASHPVIVTSALIYIGIHSTLSYLIAGIAKLRKPQWRSGRELRLSLAESSYGIPTRLIRRLERPTPAFMAAWALMIFEIAVVPALFIPHALCGWILFAFSFHLLNFAVLGLNRFFFVWIATYPALSYLGATLLK